jgi:CBS domain-containing protein
MDRLDVKRVQVLDALDSAERRDGQAMLVVGQVMTAAPSCIPPETSALELIKLFHAKQFRHLMVTDAADCLIGVISDRDVIRCLGPGQHPDPATLARITAAGIMSSDLVTVRPDTPLERAVMLMTEQGISCLPVLVERTLVGILTNTDLHVVLQILLQTLRRSLLAESIGSAASSPQI